MSEGVKVKGSVLKSRLLFVEEQGGAEAVERVRARLSPAQREELGRVLPSGWYPFALGQALDTAVAQELGGGRAAFSLRLGAASAERNLGGVHRAFLKPGDPHGFLAQAPEIFALYYDRGRRVYERVGEKEATLTTYDAEAFSESDCLTIVGWHVKALEMCGCTGVKMVEDECRARGGGVCRYLIRWQAVE